MNSLDAALQFALASQLQVSFSRVKHGGMSRPAWRNGLTGVGHSMGRPLLQLYVPCPPSPPLHNARRARNAVAVRGSHSWRARRLGVMPCCNHACMPTKHQPFCHCLRFHLGRGG